jgi:hypothetical protein
MFRIIDLFSFRYAAKYFHNIHLFRDYMLVCMAYFCINVIQFLKHICVSEFFFRSARLFFEKIFHTFLVTFSQLFIWHRAL